MTSSFQTVIGHYRLGDLIGRGGMSDVYRAEDLIDGGQVAIKIVRSGDPDLAKRLAREAEALKKFDHPGLVRVLDSGLSDEQPFLVMELVDGTTLAELLRTGARTPAQTATLGASLAGALAYVHTVGIVHRDIKPSNILISTSGEAKLADFGIARMMDDTGFTVAGTTIGTTSYMAPEQLENHQVGPSADVWSLGIVLLECLIGKRVYQGTASEVVAHRLAGPIPIPETLPVPWRLLFAGMLDHDPSRRLSPAEIAELLPTEPFASIWNSDSSVDTNLLLATQQHDLTALLPAAEIDRTTVMAPIVVAPDKEELRSSRFTRLRESKWFVAAAAILLVLALVFLARVFTGRTSLSSKPPSTSIPVTTSSSTTTTALTSAQALANLVRDVSTGVTSGAVPAATGLQISSEAEQAVSDAAAGSSSAATSNLQQVATTIASGSSNGSITTDESSTLQSDLVALADALGLGSAATTPVPTTQPVAQQPGPPGQGGGNPKGPGKGHG